MNLYLRRSELILYIDQLQTTANKHKSNGSVQNFNILSGIIEEQKENLRQLDEDISKRNKIICYQIKKDEQHD